MFQPLLFPAIGGFLFLLAIASYVFPETPLGKMDEYLKFVLSSTGSFWALYMIGRLVTDYRWEPLFMSGEWLIAMLYVWITLTHLIYPFKKVKRNRLFTIISLALLAVFTILTAIAWAGMK